MVAATYAAVTALAGIALIVFGLFLLLAPHPSPPPRRIVIGFALLFVGFFRLALTVAPLIPSP